MFSHYKCGTISLDALKSCMGTFKYTMARSMKVPVYTSDNWFAKMLISKL